ncbi:hypothetical protein RMSM_07108 [Rhodopirellula maiorica SM1]|uniref:Uncharacterized protein n=1 Tax=Rhodopirellula maiorica SM1 TaxID=1265738 RepID=M5RKU3_9BACT|nr:hypothetical protein RMSM_07108 [Rhodopirellula maiorica SM1]
MTPFSEIATLAEMVAFTAPNKFAAIRDAAYYRPPTFNFQSKIDLQEQHSDITPQVKSKQNSGRARSKSLTPRTRIKQPPA